MTWEDSMNDVWDSYICGYMPWYWLLPMWLLGVML